MAFKEIGNNILLFTAPAHRFAIDNNFKPADFPKISPTFIKQFAKVGKYKWWDSDPYTMTNNLYPETILQALAGCSAAGIALETLCVYTYGKGLGVFKRSAADGKEVITPILNPDHLAFFQANKIQDYCIKSITDYWTFANGYSRCIKSKDKTKFARIAHVDAPFVRLGYQNEKTGFIDTAYIYGNWKLYPAETDLKEVSVLDPAYATDQLAANTSAVDFIFRSYSYTPNSVYYHKHPWHASLDTGVFDLAPEIPKIRKNRFKRSLFIKYHVQIEDSYWKALLGDVKYTEALKKPEMLQEIKNSTYQAIDKHLGGADNAFKSMFSGKITDPRSGQVTELIKITPIETDWGDKAAFDPDKMSNVADIFLAFGIPAPIMNTVLSDSKSRGGGSDVREGILALQQRLKWHRDNILAPLDFVMRYNKMLADDEFLAFEDLIPTTLDVNPTGVEKTVAA